MAIHSFYLISTLFSLHCMKNILRWMKKFLVELMNQLFCNNPLTGVMGWQVMIHFSLSTVFFIWSPYFLFITEWFNIDTSRETTIWTTLVCSTRLVYLLMVGISLATEHHQPVECRFFGETYSLTTVLILLSHGASINSFEHLFLFVNFFYLSTRFLPLLTLKSPLIF